MRTKIKKLFATLLAVVLCLNASYAVQAAGTTDITLELSGYRDNGAFFYIAFSAPGVAASPNGGGYYAGGKLIIDGTETPMNTSDMYFVSYDNDALGMTLPYNKLEAGASTPSDLQKSHTVTIPAGAVIANTYTVKEDLNLLIQDGRILVDEMTKISVSLETYVANHGGAARFYIAFNAPGVEEKNYYAGSPIIIDGVETSTNTSSMYFIGTPDGLGFLLPYDQLEAGVTTAAGLQEEHTFTIPAGAIIGDKYKVAEDLNLVIKNGTIAEDNSVEVTVSLETYVANHGGAARFYIAFNAPGVEEKNYYAGSPIIIDGVATTTNLSSMYFIGTPDGLGFLLPYEQLEAGVTTAAGLQEEHTFTIPAGAVIGDKYKVAEDLNLIIKNGTITEDKSIDITLSLDAYAVNHGGAARFYIAFNAPGVEEKNYYPGSPIIIDGVATTTNLSSMYFIGTPDGLGFLLPYEQLEAGVTTAADLKQVHTFTIPAGAIIGENYRVAEDFTLVIKDGQISEGGVEEEEDTLSFVSGVQATRSRVWMTMSGEAPAAGVYLGTIKIDGVYDRLAYGFVDAADLKDFLIVLDDVMAKVQDGSEITIEPGTFTLAGDDSKTITFDNSVTLTYYASNASYSIDISGGSSDEEEEPTVYYDITEYKANNTYPTCEGKVFAGWYEDEAYTTPLDTDVTTGMAYARFVDAAVMDVKAQISAGTTATSEETNIRFVSTVDCLEYREVGFVFNIEGRGEQTKSTTKVYEKLYAVSGDQEDTILPTEFSADSAYFYAYSYYEVPNANFETVFNVQAYWITLDGTTVYGDVVQKQIIQACN